MNVDRNLEFNICNLRVPTLIKEFLRNDCMFKPIKIKKAKKMKFQNVGQDVNEDIGAWEQITSNSLLTLFAIGFVIIAIGLTAYQYIVSSPLPPIALVEFLGIGIVLFGTLWMGMGVYLSPDKLTFLDELKKAGTPNSATPVHTSLRAVINILEEASVWCYQGSLMVLFGSMIGLSAFIYHQAIEELSKHADNHGQNINCKRIENKLVNKDVGPSSSSVLLECSGI